MPQVRSASLLAEFSTEINDLSTAVNCPTNMRLAGGASDVPEQTQDPLQLLLRVVVDEDAP